MPYIVRRRNVWEDDDESESSSTASAVLEPEESDAICTGLLDSFGRSLYRIPGRIKMGYVK